MKCGTCGAVLPDFTDPSWMAGVSAKRVRFEFTGSPLHLFGAVLTYVCGCGDAYYPHEAQMKAAA